jgi:hypothetical protein
METKLTSVKVIKELYNKFRKITLDEKLTFQQLVNRSINLYVSDEKYKTSINEYKNLQIVSGSKF